MLNLDTHMVIHTLAGALTAAERAILESDRWGISAIVLWELAKLVQLGRVQLDLDSPGFRHFLQNVHVWPLDLDVSVTSTRLDFRSDPADELIAATSIVFAAPLVTRDSRMLASRVVPLAARVG